MNCKPIESIPQASLRLTKHDKRNMCVGCRDDFYNGQNPYGIAECWNLKTARIVMKKKVSISQVPPWNQKPIHILNCRHESGYIFVEKDARY